MPTDLIWRQIATTSLISGRCLPDSRRLKRSANPAPHRARLEPLSPSLQISFSQRRRNTFTCRSLAGGEDGGLCNGTRCKSERRYGNYSSGVTGGFGRMQDPPRQWQNKERDGWGTGWKQICFPELKHPRLYWECWFWSEFGFTQRGSSLTERKNIKIALFFWINEIIIWTFRKKLLRN